MEDENEIIIILIRSDFDLWNIIFIHCFGILPCVTAGYIVL